MHLTANEASRKASEVRILHPPQFYRDMEQQNTIENSVASAILEKSIDNIDIEGVTYEIAPPSTATLILISEIVATLPVVKKVPAEEIVTSYEGENETYIEASAENSGSTLYDKEIRDKPRTRHTKRNV